MMMMMVVVVVCRIYIVSSGVFSRFLVGQMVGLSVGKRLLLRNQENSKGQIHSRRRLTPAATINCRRRRRSARLSKISAAAAS